MCNYEQILSMPNATVVTEYTCQQQSLQYQSEADLEQALINKLVAHGYEYLPIKAEPDLLSNLRKQMEKINQITFTDAE